MHREAAKRAGDCELGYRIRVIRRLDIIARARMAAPISSEELGNELLRVAKILLLYCIVPLMSITGLSKESNLDEGFLGHTVPEGKWAKVVVTDIGLPSPSR